MKPSTSRRRAMLAGLGLLAALLLAMPATAAACGEEAPPVVTNAKATPVGLPFQGGTVKITVDVESDCGALVWAEISSTEAAYFAFEMLPTEETVNDDPRTYRAEFSPPANYQEWSVGYQITISAQDADGATETGYAEFEVEGAPQFNEPPYVSDATVTPRKLGTEGGWVTIGADIGDTQGINTAFAIVTLPDETQIEVPLENPYSYSHYIGHFKAPANYGTAAARYAVTVYGEDDIGQQSYESAGTFAVAGRPCPLSVEVERTGNIGNVTLGKTATRVVTVHNSSGPKTKWIKASLAVSSSSFSLRNATAGKIGFTIGPGETRRFRLELTPTGLGPATGTLTLSRPDGVQPDSVLNLTGKGIPPAS